MHAINWGYRIFKDAKTAEDEYPYLNKIITDKKGDPMYEFEHSSYFSMKTLPTKLKIWEMIISKPATTASKI